MEVTIKQESNNVLAQIHGRIDTTNAKEFEAAISQLINGDNLNIELDCENLSYISSSGLRVFLLLQKSVSAHNGALTILNLSPAIKEIFVMTGFDSIFDIR